MVYRDYFEKMGVQDASKMVRGIAYTMLLSTMKSNDVTDRPDKSEIYMPEDLAEDKPLMHLLDLAGYWGNDLLDVFNEYCDREGVTGDLRERGYKAIWEYLGV